MNKYDNSVTAADLVMDERNPFVRVGAWIMAMPFRLWEWVRG